MNRMYGNYQLREAAGFYWLIDMTQTGKNWKKPLQLNETGAALLHGFYEGRSQEELAGELAEDYGLPVEEMRKDVASFFSQLAANGIHTAQTGGESTGQADGNCTAQTGGEGTGQADGDCTTRANGES